MLAILTCLSLAVIDGDTLKCDGERLRLLGDGAPNVAGFDTPETYRPKCQAELELGRAATSRMKELVQTPGFRIEDSGVRDKFGRKLVAVRLPDGSTAGARMISEGYARKWYPGYRANWCT